MLGVYCCWPIRMRQLRVWSCPVQREMSRNMPAGHVRNGLRGMFTVFRAVRHVYVGLHQRVHFVYQRSRSFSRWTVHWYLRLSGI